MNGWTASANEYRLRIEEWPEGFYLFVFRGEETVPFRDDFQNTLAHAMIVADEDYGVPESSWVEEEWPRSIR